MTSLIIDQLWIFVDIKSKKRTSSSMCIRKCQQQMLDSIIFFLRRHLLAAFLTFCFSKLHIMSDQLYHIRLDPALLPKLDFPRSTMLQPIQRLKITDCSFLVWCNCPGGVCQKANTETKHRPE